MFVCTVSHEHITFEFIQDGSSSYVLVPIGYDDDDDRDLSYFASVGVDALAGGGSEMYFAIIEQDHETDETYRYWSGRDTSAFILGNDRNLVLEAVCMAAQILIDRGTPDEMEITTYDENPPDRAVIKHFRVMSVFERNGYKITTFDSYTTKRYWRLERAKG